MPVLTPPVIIFFSIASVTVLTALGMLISRNTVYAALFLVLNFSTVAFLYFVLGAPFIALAQITVYAGAIMVLFLFVIMLLGTEKLTQNEPVGFMRVFTGLVGLVLLAEAGFMIFTKVPQDLAIATPLQNYATAEAIGSLLYGKFLLPFEVTSFILLVAVIGAIVLTKTEGKSIRQAPPSSGEVK